LSLATIHNAQAAAATATAKSVRTCIEAATRVGVATGLPDVVDSDGLHAALLVSDIELVDGMLRLVMELQLSIQGEPASPITNNALYKGVHSGIDGDCILGHD
jgi:hypothetical protein